MATNVTLINNSLVKEYLTYDGQDGLHITVALGRVVSPKRHFELENVLLQAIALECGALRLIQTAFCNDACCTFYV